jgi:hypothetical protein
MDMKGFRESFNGATPPASLSNALQALWYDAKGDWDTAHKRAQAQEDANGAWVHAYLHRKEGDLSNAGHWYRRAGKPVANTSLDAEWESLVTALLSQESSKT